MNKSLLLISPLILIIIISGCTQTGKIINKSAELLNETESETESPDLTVTPQVQEQINETYVSENETGQLLQDPCENMACPDSVTTCPDGYKARCKNTCTNGVCSVCRPSCVGHDPCENITCEYSTATCPDGYKATCQNTCVNGTCTECEPDCSGHEVHGDSGNSGQSCKLSCGLCEEENIITCTCDLIIPCDGNGICEEGEYPASSDCPDCTDEDNCTTDFYNYTTKQCEHEILVPCCGDSVCTEPEENHTTCPEDCEEPEWGNYSNVIISEIMYNPDQCHDSDCEWIEIYNTGNYKINLSGWTIDNNTFDAEIIQPKEYVVIARELTDGKDADIQSFEYFWGDNSMVWGDSGTENYTAFDGAMILNNNNDTVTLRSPGSYYDSVTYFSAWGADGNNRTLERCENGTWTESLVDNGTPGFRNSI